MARYDEQSGGGGQNLAEVIKLLGGGKSAEAALSDAAGAPGQDPWPMRWQERESGTKCGPCENNAEFRVIETLFTVRRYGVMFVNVSRTAIGDLVINATPAPIRCFVAGVGEAGTASNLLPAGANLTRAETDAYKKGALVPLDKLDFRVTSVGFSLLDGHRVTSNDVATVTRMGDPFWRAYGPELASRLCANSHFLLRHGSGTGTGYEMGRMDFYPTQSGVQREGGVTIGRPLAGALIPLDRPDFSGGPDEDDSLSVELIVDHTHGVSNDGINMIPVLGAGEAYQFPVSVELFGRNVRNRNIVNKAEVQEVATAASLKVLSLVAESLDLSDPSALAKFRALLKQLGQG